MSGTLSVSTQRFKYYDLIMVAFVTVLICSNVIGPSKLWTLNLFGEPVVMGAAILFFPVSYLFGDVLTEVYGYARARRVVWSGFAALMFASLMSWTVLSLPVAPGWPHQTAFEVAFGSTWRMAVASIVGYFFGEICNSYVLARMKIWTSGRWLFTRTIGSTLVGEAVDTLIFYPLAFAGIWSWDQLLAVMFASYFFKVMWEVLATPFTYRLVAWLKRAEGVDVYDRDTDFNPFKMSP